MEKKFDLEERTLQFSKDLLFVLKKIPKTSINIPLINQVIRSGTAIGANYIEANDSLGTKDFVMRTKIARKEAKETLYWLNLLLNVNEEFMDEINKLLKECVELKNILSAIIKNSQ
ncbi:MAG TPA: four helix bundle protein [Candidatus Eisenbacteria bacterium]|nr:four helix bundle protein [Candidatus Eisenbacteria bacterium]